jgi:ribosome-associated protein
VRAACRVPKRRVPTKPTKASKERRIGTKKQLSQTKSLRGKVRDD